jgi:hypothetical protein
MTDPNRSLDPDRAESVRRALIEAALAAYEDAGLSGLCEEGRWEAAIGAMRRVDLTQLAARSDANRR